MTTIAALGSVLSDVLGKSGRAMLDAIVAGQSDPALLAALAQARGRRRCLSFTLD